ncbi:MAG TPA: DUF1592 domain-containing protein [Pirellulaceae bacterium]|nr:DUF1592 domain-containing protein [Pirellulaceae bacterium]
MVFAPASRFAALLSSALILCASRSTAAQEHATPELPTTAIAFIETHCLDCHAGDGADAGLDLSGIDSLDRFVKDRLKFDAARRMVAAGEMPPADVDQPDPADRLAFVDTMSQFYDSLDATLPPQPGRVTMRRLNRVEYRNTIRDLIGVDFDPTESFPSDEIGHGFDNVGETLTISPLLLERYLAAAESIVERAITPEPPPVPRRRQAARFTEPAAREIPLEGEWRVVSSTATEPIGTGPLHVPYEFEEQGEYLFRTRVFKRFDGGPVRVAVMVWGKDETDAASDEMLAQIVGDVRRPARILEIVEVTADSADDPQTIEVKVPPGPGRERMSLGLLRTEGDVGEAQLLVEHFALRGPLDSRPASHLALLDAPEDADAATKSRVALERFLRRAYRRPPTDDEVARLVDLVAYQMEQGKSWEGGMQIAIQAALCSPKFLFRVELDDRPDADGTRELDPFQLASRLSYFLWSSMPDDELLALAESGELPSRLDEQVTRMLADPKSSALVQNFAPQWLQIQRLDAFVPDTDRFPQFDERLRRAMMRETMMFFEAVVREDRPIGDLLDADFTYLNEPLARLYGIADTKGNRIGQAPTVPGGEPIRGREFVRVELQDRQRGGLVTMASVLSVTSNPTRTSPVKRGRWVLEQLLGAPPPPPPPDVPLLEEADAAVATGSLRERLEQHRRDPACANCHAKMDPIGFALESFDAIGAYRTMDGEFEIDSVGEFPDGTRFEGVEDLKTILRQRRDDFAQCLTEKLMIYALGRGLQYYDRPTVVRISRQAAADGDRFSSLIRAIVASPAFRSRGPYLSPAESTEMPDDSTE